MTEPGTLLFEIGTEELPAVRGDRDGRRGRGPRCREAGRDPARPRRRSRRTRTPRRDRRLRRGRGAARAGRRAHGARPAGVAAFDADGDADQGGRRASPAARASTVGRPARLDVDGVEYVGGDQHRRRPRRGRGAAAACSPRSSPSCAPRRTCGGTTRSCRSPGRSAGWSRCSASRGRPGRGVVAGRRPDHPGAPHRGPTPGRGRRRPTATWTSSPDHGIVADPARRRAQIVAAAQRAGGERRRHGRRRRRGRAARRDHQPGRGADRDPRRLRGALPRAAGARS